MPPHPDAPDRPVTRRTVRCAGRRSPRTGTATGLPDRGDPTIVVYLILSKQFVHGLTLGSTKARRRPAPYPIRRAPTIAPTLNPAPTIPDAVAAEIAIVRSGTNQR